MKIGTIIDPSFFETYHTVKGNIGYSYKICPYCEKEIELSCEHFDAQSRSQGVAGTLPHECSFWIDEARHRVGIYEKHVIPHNGFIFIDTKGKIEYQSERNQQFLNALRSDYITNSKVVMSHKTRR